MRFKCGETKEEYNARITKLYNWHDWFAWYPVSIEQGRCVWLEVIQRKFKIRNIDYHFWTETHYRFK